MLKKSLFYAGVFYIIINLLRTFHYFITVHTFNGYLLPQFKFLAPYVAIAIAMLCIGACAAFWYFNKEIPMKVLLHNIIVVINRHWWKILLLSIIVWKFQGSNTFDSFALLLNYERSLLRHFVAAYLYDLLWDRISGCYIVLSLILCLALNETGKTKNMAPYNDSETASL